MSLQLCYLTFRTLRMKFHDPSSKVSVHGALFREPGAFKGLSLAVRSVASAGLLN